MHDEVAAKELARHERRIQEAVTDEQNKEGPPMLLEMAANEQAYEGRTELLNQIGGRENYIQIFANRQHRKKQQD